MDMFVFTEDFEFNPFPEDPNDDTPPSDKLANRIDYVKPL